MSKKTKDEIKAYREMGKRNEATYKPILEKHFNKDLYKFEGNDFSVIDFYGDNIRIELKSRSNKYDDYNETIVGNNKVIELFDLINEKKKNNIDYKCYFAFAFTDGFYIWELNDENYEANGGKNQVKIAGTYNRGFPEFKEHLYIKIENLIKIDDTPCYVNSIVKEKKQELKKYKEQIGICLLKLPKKQV